MEREVGGGIGMGNTCKPMADSFQCMTKPTTIKKKKERKKKESELFNIGKDNVFFPVEFHLNNGKLKLK